MAILLCTEQKGGGKRNGAVTKDSISRERTFLVVTSSDTDDSTDVETAPGIDLFDSHPSDSNIVCTSVSSTEIEPKKEGSVWEVRFTYETSPWDACEENPLLNCDPKYSWSTEKEEEIFNEDVNGDKIKNSAGDPFQPLPTRIKSRAVLTVTYNAATFSGATALALDSKVNSDTFEGAAPETLLLSIESAVENWHKNVGYYWKITLKMTYKEDGWNPMKILDAGMREIDPDDATKKRHIKLKGNMVTNPVPLSDGTAIEDPDTDPEYLEFDPYDAIAFNSLF